MGTLDIIIAIVLGIGLVRGLMSGFLKQAASLVGTILAFVLAASFMEPAGRLLELRLGMMDEISSMVAFIGIFMLVKLSVSTVTNAAKTLLDKTPLSGLDRVAGGVAGGLKAAIVMSLIFLAAGMADLPGRTARETSSLYQPMYRLVPDSWRYISDRSPAFEELRQKVEARLDFGKGSLPI